MNIMKIKLVTILTTVLCLVACESKVDFGEQYKKTIYIVNSQNILFTGEHSFNTENDAIEVSVYCACTEPIKHDLKVKLKVTPEVLANLNTQNSLGNPYYVDKLILPDSNYEMNDDEVTILAGQQYGVFKVPINLEGLDADKSYTLPLSIVSNSFDYDINPELQQIVYEIKFTNDYAGDYVGNSVELDNGKERSVQMTLKALSKNQVRMPIHNLPSSDSFLSTNFMILTIGADGNVDIQPWGNAQIVDLGDSRYDVNTHTFELNYEFVDDAGETVKVQESIRNTVVTAE